MSSLSPSKSSTSIDTLEPECLNNPDSESSQTFTCSVQLDVVNHGHDIIKSTNFSGDDLSEHLSPDNSNEQVELIDSSEEVLIKPVNSEPSSNEGISSNPNNEVSPTDDDIVWVENEKRYNFNVSNNNTFHRRFPQIDQEEKLIDCKYKPRFAPVDRCEIL